MLVKYDRYFRNGIAGWCFDKAEIEKAHETNGILMLDMEYGIRCCLDCSYCFRRNDQRDYSGRVRSTALKKEDIICIVEQAKEMGAKSIHFVGKGESMEEPDFLEIVRHINNLNMIPLIFTAGHVLGNDDLARSIHSRSGQQIVDELYALNASIILKLNSLNERTQNDMVGRTRFIDIDRAEKQFNYTEAREIALKRLMESEFNHNRHNPTRLGTATVMLQSNYYELLHHYRYFRSMNIYPIINTVVPCGRTQRMEEITRISPTTDQKLNLWKQIYKFNVESGIKYEGISSYVGGHICSQLGYALYVNVYGEVFDCPSSARASMGNVKSNGNKLVDIWKASKVRKQYQGSLNNGCPWRSRYSYIFPKNLFDNVHEYLRKTFPNDIQTSKTTSG